MRPDPAKRERDEFLASCLSSFPRFCSLLDILPIQGGARCKFRLNKIQKQYLRDATQRDVVLKPRRVGFTTLLCARDIFEFLTVPSTRVVTVCQSQSNYETFRQLSGMYRLMFEGLESSGLGINFGVKKTGNWTLPEKDSQLELITAGASEASASSKGRGGNITRLHLTETSSYVYAEDTLTSLMASVTGLHTGSQVVSESTPKGAGGYFYEQCQRAIKGSDDYRFHFYPWFDDPEYRRALDEGEVIEPANEREEMLMARGVRPDQIKWYRVQVATNGQDAVDQEFPTDPETCFLVSGRPFFDQAQTTRLLNVAADPIEERKQRRIRIYAKPVPGVDYVFPLDCSEGVGGDPSGGLMYRRDTGEHVATLDGQFHPHEAAGEAVALCHEYNGALLAPERNNHGHAVIEAAANSFDYRYIYKHHDDKRGWPTNVVTRPVMLDELESAHRLGLWKSPDRGVLGQLRTFVVTDSGKAEASSGSKDDLVIAAAIGWQVRARGSIRGTLDSSIAACL